MKNMTLFTALTILMFSIGCSGLSKSDCTNTNWKEKGVVDGTSGQAAEKILKTEKVCSKKGAEFPITEYKNGWLEGIAVYCSPQNGFKLSSEGKKVDVENCPIEFRPALLQNIKLGQEFAGVESKIKSLEKDKSSMKEEKQDVKEKISKIESELNTLKEKKEELSKAKDTVETPATTVK
jgi:hypothetical protein